MARGSQSKTTVVHPADHLDLRLAASPIPASLLVRVCLCTDTVLTQPQSKQLTSSITAPMRRDGPAGFVVVSA